MWRRGLGLSPRVHWDKISKVAFIHLALHLALVPGLLPPLHGREGFRDNGGLCDSHARWHGPASHSRQLMAALTSTCLEQVIHVTYCMSPTFRALPGAARGGLPDPVGCVCSPGHLAPASCLGRSGVSRFMNTAAGIHHKIHDCDTGECTKQTASAALTVSCMSLKAL